MDSMVLVALAVCAGAALQRLTGMGLALVAAPFLVLIMGPVTGVVLVNFCGATASILVLCRAFMHVDWKKYAILGPSAVLGVFPGVLIVGALPGPWLEVGVGCVVLVALTTSLTLRGSTIGAGARPLILAGAASGIMGATAGIGGPAISVYAVVSNWEQCAFAATLQPCFFTTGVTSLVVKYLASPQIMPPDPGGMMAWAGVGILSGLCLGELLTRWIRPARARILAVGIAYAGAAGAMLRGILGLWT